MARVEYTLVLLSAGLGLFWFQRQVSTNRAACPRQPCPRARSRRGLFCDLCRVLHTMARRLCEDMLYARKHHMHGHDLHMVFKGAGGQAWQWRWVRAPAHGTGAWSNLAGARSAGCVACP